MVNYKILDDIDFSGKKTLIRLDLNVPYEKGKISDYTRIDTALPTIKSIEKQGGRVILMSHFGRPGGKAEKELTLAPVARSLTEKLGKEVKMASDCVGNDVEELVNNMKNGEIILLENLRFHQGEENNEENFINQLCKLADVYVFDAFGVAHRAHASTYGVPLKLKDQGKEVCAGLLLDKELEIWKPIVEGKGKSVAIVGGAKLKEKIKAVKRFSESFDTVILGGVVANVFLRAAGFNIGKSKYMEKDVDYTNDAKKILNSDKNDKIILPSKVEISDKEFITVGIGDVELNLKDDLMTVDVIIGEMENQIIQKAERIVWFGPMGAYEFGFKKGSGKIVEAINNSNGYAVLGGGDLAAAAVGVKAQISTGGGASIEYITKGKLPGLQALS